eukprot:8859439-Pyramimonas_sp.AAC.1
MDSMGLQLIDDEIKAKIMTFAFDPTFANYARFALPQVAWPHLYVKWPDDFPEYSRVSVSAKAV